VTTGVEVQRSSMTASRAVIRTRKAATAGVTDVWFCGRDGSPPWAWRVPTVLPRELGIDRPYDGETWTIMPPRRAVTAAGLRVLRAVKCAVGNIDRCPYGRNWCGKYHPRPVPWGGVKVDDVAAKFPAGEIVLLQLLGRDHAEKPPPGRHFPSVASRLPPIRGNDRLVGERIVQARDRGPAAADAERCGRVPQRTASRSAHNSVDTSPDFTTRGNLGH